MDWDADRKLDLAGAILAGLVLVSVVLLAFGAAQGAGNADDVPDVEWSVDRINESHVEITHEGGDTVYAEEIAVIVDGQGHPNPFEGAIRPGDSAVSPVTETSLVQLYWEDETGTRTLLYSQDHRGR